MPYLFCLHFGWIWLHFTESGTFPNANITATLRWKKNKVHLNDVAHINNVLVCVTLKYGAIKCLPALDSLKKYPLPYIRRKVTVIIYRNKARGRASYFIRSRNPQVTCKISFITYSRGYFISYPSHKLLKSLVTDMKNKHGICSAKLNTPQSS